MNRLIVLIAAGFIALAALPVCAQTGMGQGMSGDSMEKKDSMGKKDSMAKKDSMGKKDSMEKKHPKKDSMAKKDSMGKDSMDKPMGK